MRYIGPRTHTHTTLDKVGIFHENFFTHSTLAESDEWIAAGYGFASDSNQSAGLAGQLARRVTGTCKTNVA